MTVCFNGLGNEGRLGNQMFQYAFMRGMSKKHGYDYIVHLAGNGKMSPADIDKFMKSIVDENYDTGPIVLQKTVVIEENDSYNTLADKVLAIEHRIYPEVVKAFCEDRIVWDNKQPKIEVAIEN